MGIAFAFAPAYASSVINIAEQVQAINSGPVGAFRERACAAEEQPRREISDHLVEKLDCGNLTAANVLTFVPPGRIKEKFETIGTIYVNFGDTGMAGHCWAITKAQRKALLLLTVAPVSPAKTSGEALEQLKDLTKKSRAFRNLVRGSAPDPQCPDKRKVTDIEDICYDADKREPPVKMQMIAVNSVKEMQDLISISKDALLTAAQSYPSLSNFTVIDSDWLNRNQHLLPNIYKAGRRRSDWIQRNSDKIDRAGIAYQNQESFLKSQHEKGLISDAQLERDLKNAEQAFKDERTKVIFGGPEDKKEREELTKLQSSYELPPPSDDSFDFEELRDDIKLAQRRRFFRPGNVKFLTGNRERSESADRSTVQDLKRQLQLGRLPILNIRFGLAKQHIMMAQSYEENADGSINFKVYDSNAIPVLSEDEQKKIVRHAPKLETITYKNGRFYFANEPGLSNAEKKAAAGKPVGVFITDDEEMDEIQNVVYQHYKKKCEAFEK